MFLWTILQFKNVSNIYSKYLRLQTPVVMYLTFEFHTWTIDLTLLLNFSMKLRMQLFVHAVTGCLTLFVLLVRQSLLLCYNWSIVPVAIYILLSGYASICNHIIKTSLLFFQLKFYVYPKGYFNEALTFKAFIIHLLTTNAL